MSLRGDELMEALVPTAERFVAAVHDMDDAAVAEVFAEAERLAGHPLVGARALAIAAAAMASEDHGPEASLGWTRNPTEYHRLRSGMDALTASLRAGRTEVKGDAA